MKTEISEAENGYIIKREKYSREEIRDAKGSMSAHDITANIKILCLSKGQLLEEIAKIYKD